MAVIHSDHHSTYFYSSTHLHNTSKIYLILLHQTHKLQCYLLQTWKILTKLKVKLEKDTGYHLLPKPIFCEWLVTGMSESPVHGEEAALGKHSHIWCSSLFLLALKHTTLLGCSKVDLVIELKLSILPSFSKPRDSVTSANFTYMSYMLFLVDFLPESWPNCMGHTELKNQLAVSSPSYFPTYIYKKAKFYCARICAQSLIVTALTENITLHQCRLLLWIGFVLS